MQYAFELAAALTLADLGQEVWATGRTPPHASQAGIEFIPCDFSDRAQIGILVQHIVDSQRRIDVLLHNAATITAPPRTTGGVTTDCLVNVLAPIVWTELLCRQGRLGRMVVVLAGVQHNDRGPMDPSALHGLAGCFRGKQLLAAALFHVALQYRVGCHFFRPPGTDTELQAKILDTLPLRRPGWLRSAVSWLNRSSLRDAREVGGRLAQVALHSTGLAPFTISGISENAATQILAIEPPRGLKALIASCVPGAC
jgi:short chain dehydrogenase